MNMIPIIGRTSREPDTFERFKRSMRHVTIMLTISIAVSGVTLGMVVALVIQSWKH